MTEVSGLLAGTDPRGKDTRRQANVQAVKRKGSAGWRSLSVFFTDLAFGRFGVATKSPIARQSYSTIFDTTPDPTVRPPSRIAKRSPCSIAIGAISSTLNFRLSPGITISVPAGSSTVPVTSVVRK